MKLSRRCKRVAQPCVACKARLKRSRPSLGTVEQWIESESAITRFVSVNGELIPPQEACVSVFNPVIFGAFGVYESIQLRESVPFHLDDHLQRLVFSASLIQLPIPASRERMAGWVSDLIDAHRAVLTPGEADAATIRLFPHRSASPSTTDTPMLFIWLQPLERPDPSAYEHGLGAVTYEGERILPPG